MAKRSLGNQNGSRKPDKPHQDYPLTPHASGQFCKKIRGKIYYFGSDPDKALREYNAIKDNLLEGIDPRHEKPGETIGWLCNAFMDSRKARLQSGELTQRTLADYHDCVKRLSAFFGKSRRLESLGPMDFGPLKADFQKTWGPVRTNNEIGRVSVVLNYAYKIDAVDRPIKTGPDFAKPSAKVLRLTRGRKAKREFTAEQIHKLIEIADPQLRAMIYLGINCGYGPADCGRLENDWIDLKRSWLCEMRHKTGIEREAWLWPETAKAIREAQAMRPEPTDPEYGGRTFLTKYGNPWHRDDRRDSPISQAITKLTESLGIYQTGVSFYALRHVFQTQGEGCGDMVAVSRVMGHGDSSMSERYREGIDPERIKTVCKHVRKWWLAGKLKAKKARAGKGGAA